MNPNYYFEIRIMPHFTGFAVASYGNNSFSSGESDDDDGNYFINCSHCDARVLQRNYNRHLANVHKCPHCDNFMPRDSLDGHIERKHTVNCEWCGVSKTIDEIVAHESSHYKQCQYCRLDIYEGVFDNHIRQTHPLAATIGMIQSLKITDNRFNELVAANRIYSKDGHLFIKH